MGDYTESKSAIAGTVDPPGLVASAFDEFGPLISGAEVYRRYMFGVPRKAPGTGQVMTDEMLDEHVLDAVAELQEEMSVSIFPRQFDERQPFDRNEYMSLGYMRTRQRPVASVQELAVTASNDHQIWKVALDWIENGYLPRGEIYLLPLNVAVAPSQSVGNPAGGTAFLAILGQLPWVPAYWRLRYTAGFPDGRLPRALNGLIGIVTAINALNLMAQANAKSGSQSIGIDGLSQSTSNPGPQVYKEAIAELKERKKVLVGRMKKRFGTGMIVGNV